MCSFDTVICPCPLLGDWVRTDQSRADCAGEHFCESQDACPLVGQFADALVPAPAQRQRVDLPGWRT